ncbi:MAG: hypothetical protein EA413_06945 [Cyanobium sp. PLM2.Bin73]|nr:MAG: hypothetical protein EA413_06945 [Cyanobium sp. PLM2.Bin73]
MTTASKIDPQWHALLAAAMPEKQRLELSLKAAEDDRHRLTVTVTLRAGPTRELEIALSQGMAQTLPPLQSIRVQQCLRAWLPWLLKLHQRIRCDYSLNLSMCDGGQAGMPSMDSQDWTALIPDLYTMQAAVKREKYGKPMAFPRFLARWQKRRPQIFWRGSTTGMQRGGSIQDVAGLQANPRVQISLRHRNHEACNIKISRVVQMDPAFSSAAKEWLNTAGILAPPVQESTFGNYRYYPDIPGNALAWGTIFKHLRGCLVLRAPHKRALYHYRLMQPWKHYIPVEPDFSDLDTAVAWAEAHPEQAAWIAWCGHWVAHRYLRQIGFHFSDAVLPHIQPVIPLQLRE